MKQIETPEINFEKLLEAINKLVPVLTNVDKPHQRLEEINYNKETKCWEVVISYLQQEEPNESVLSYLAYSSGEKETIVRKFKRVTINEDWRVLGYSLYDSN
ncbi:hypothetical protein EP342_00825 [bacterium]|nr:MAG: hypothetical protein EP342_00825 [bacterium]